MTSALERLLGGPDTEWLVKRIRARMPVASGERLSGTVRLAQPSAEQRAAIVRLLGPPRRPGSSLSVDLAAVEEMLRRGPWPAGLADAVEVLTGPVRDRREEAESEAAEWEAAVAVLDGVPGLDGWWRAWCAQGGLKKAAGSEARRRGAARPVDVAAELTTQAARILAELPATGEPIAVLARRTLGDAHGLDADRPMGRILTTIVAVAFDTVVGASRRDVWAAAGVELSNVSSTVLGLGVPGATGALDDLGSATAGALQAMRAARAAVVLTLDQVRSGGVSPLPPDATVHVCENPTVVEIAARRWSGAPAASPVLVCAGGQPSAAVVELLEQLTAAGARCLYHGDFDWGGLRIAASLRRRVPWQSWRYGAEDYRAAVAHDADRGRPLTGTPTHADWDPDLAAAMGELGVVIEEESVADTLIDDLLA